MNKISRAQFLRGDWQGEMPVIAPPWAVASDRFKEICEGCGECAMACPQRIIKPTPRGFPRIDFLHGECTFCGECVTACPTGALVINDDNRDQPWQVRARVSNACLAVNGTSCVRCIESCPKDAIAARPALQGRVQMRVIDSACNGCGACIAPCPVDAIAIGDPGFEVRAEEPSSGEQHGPVMHQ